MNHHKSSNTDNCRSGVRLARFMAAWMLVLLLWSALTPDPEVRRTWFIWASFSAALLVISTGTRRLPEWAYSWLGIRILCATLVFISLGVLVLVKQLF